MADEQMVLVIERKGAGACRTCGAPIEWARTVAGALMPLESELRVRALLAPELRRERSFLVGTAKSGKLVVIPPERRAEFEARGPVREELHLVWEIPASLTHWANCVTADQHRRVGGKARR